MAYDQFAQIFKTKASDVLKANDALSAQVQQLSAMILGMDAPPRTVTVYGQRQEPWAGDHIAGTIYTIGAEGCLMTSAASMLTDAGHPFTPRELNVWLMSNRGYIIENGHSAYVWAAVDVLGVVKYQTTVACWNTAAPLPLMEQAIKDDHFVLVEVDFLPDLKPQQHWLRLLSMDGSVMDAWTGEIGKITRYRGSNLSECTRGVSIYHRTGI